MSDIRQIQKALADGVSFVMEGETGSFSLRPIAGTPADQYELLRGNERVSGMVVFICDRNLLLVKMASDYHVENRNKFFVEIKFV